MEFCYRLVVCFRSNWLAGDCWFVADYFIVVNNSFVVDYSFADSTVAD